jgi:hypothetical protein
LAGCYWTQPGYDAHRSGFNPHEHAITAANAATLEIDWTSPPILGPVSGVVRSRAGLLHVLGQMSDHSVITTLDPDDGSVVWTAEIDVAGPRSTLLAAGDELLVPTYRPAAEPYGCLRRIDASDGTDLGCHAFEAVDPTVVPAPSTASLATVVSGRWVVTVARYFVPGVGYHAWLSVTNLVDPAQSWDAAVPGGPHEWATHPLIVGATVVMATIPDDVDQTVLLRWPLDCPVGQCSPTADPLAVPIGAELAANADGTRLAVLGYGGDDDPDLEVVDLTNGSTMWTADLGTNVFPIGRPMWTPTSLFVHVVEAGSPDETISSFGAGGCGSSTCQPDRSAASNLGFDSQIVGAADIIAFSTRERALVVMASHCAPACDPLYEYEDDGGSAQPILTDGRIITMVESTDGNHLAAFAPLN